MYIYLYILEYMYVYTYISEDSFYWATILSRPSRTFPH